MKQSSTINGLYGHNTAHASSAGNAAILELVGGQTVSVMAISASYLIGAGDEVYCTFSGFMLYSTGPSIFIG
ncbi:hypothetical protein DPMN_157968 [Dreissena polymorpha]|uniref:C1q domain-containing protein n=1 Tax=Dreissena polymorpha TaxID=45954 RepID=A0A9D4EIB2_DREPO|nr:hypothetical protein DPMN_157968 [Dreissena polymorpha]